MLSAVASRSWRGFSLYGASGKLKLITNARSTPARLSSWSWSTSRLAWAASSRGWTVRTRGRTSRRTTGSCIPSMDNGAALKVLRNSGSSPSRQAANPSSVMATGFPVPWSRLILARYSSVVRACCR